MATILVVDDHAATREGFARLFRHSGYVVLTAGDVATAQQLLAEAAPDLLITDVRLDAYNGLQLIAMAPQRIRAVVLTGYADRSIEADARRLGAEYYVKPIAPSTCLEIVKRLLASPIKAPTETRRAVRHPLTLPVSIRVGSHLGRVLDVSSEGMRMEIHSADDVALEGTLTLHLGSPAFAVPVAISWRRRVGERTWICGATVLPDAQPTWRAFLGSLA
jgi:DNA-binding NarL/FixJ family response regulator